MSNPKYYRPYYDTSHEDHEALRDIEPKVTETPLQWLQRIVRAAMRVHPCPEALHIDACVEEELWYFTYTGEFGAAASTFVGPAQTSRVLCRQYWARIFGLPTVWDSAFFHCT